MIVSSDKRNVESNGSFTTNAFQIAASPKAFSILSSQLYTNKPRAIIRELAANAADAHAAAKTTKPFIVEFPGPLSPIFRIRDFGTGLSEEAIKTLYTTYFGSNKTHSNEQIGGLGLGSKSPFAYTDQFTVVSFFNGTKTTYQAFINEDAIPNIAKLNEEPTTEPNGLEVLLPVKPADTASFEAEADVLRFFDPMPDTSVPIKTPTYSRVLDLGDGIKVGIREDNIRTTYIVQGPIPYPVTPSVFQSNTAALLFHTPIDIHVPVGFCEIAASREGLSYTKQTNATLDKLAGKISTVLEQQLKEAIQEATTLPEAYKILQTTSYLRSAAGFLVSTSSIKWKNHELFPKGVYTIKLPTTVKARTVDRNDNWGTRREWDTGMREVSVELSPGITNHKFYRRERGGPFLAFFDELYAKDAASCLNTRFIILEGPDADIDAFLTAQHLTAEQFPKVTPKGNSGRARASLGKAQYSAYLYNSGEEDCHHIHGTAKLILQYAADKNAPIYFDESFAHDSLRKVLSPPPTLITVSVPSSHNKVREAFAETQYEIGYEDYLITTLDRSKLKKAYESTLLNGMMQAYYIDRQTLINNNRLPTKEVAKTLCELYTKATNGKPNPTLVELFECAGLPNECSAIAGHPSYTQSSAYSTINAVERHELFRKELDKIISETDIKLENTIDKAKEAIKTLEAHFPLVFSRYFIGLLINQLRYSKTPNWDLQNFVVQYMAWATKPNGTPVPITPPHLTEDYTNAA